MKTQLKTLVRFVWKNQGWHHYATDRDTVELICAAANLGIIEIKGGQYALKSVEHARQYLNN
jgi:hypothetical protein